MRKTRRKIVSIGLFVILLFNGIQLLVSEEQSDNYMSEQITTPKFLYLVLSKEEWNNSQGIQQLKLSSHHDAFIHLATEQQVAKILEKFWPGKECVIVKVDTNMLKGRLVFEKNPGGSNKYYHLYDGYIPQNAVIDMKQCPTDH